MHRLFVAIRPPSHIRDLLIDAMGASAELGWVPEENLHLTLRFVGEVERPVAEDLAGALDTIRLPAFDLKITGVGQFSRRNGGALWARVTPRADVSALAAKVERACLTAGLEHERRAFHPHITLARWSGRKSAEVQSFLTDAAGLTSDAFRVDKFALFESRLSRHGAHYEIVGEYRLV